VNYLNFFDPFKGGLCTCGKKITINPYTGCNHRCRYCYITSYIKDGFKLRLKNNYIQTIKREIEKIKENYPVNLSSSSDPYPEIEKKLLLTRKTLLMLKEKNLRVSIITKSPLVMRDIDILKETESCVSFTITHYEDKLLKKIEPHAPPVSERIKAAGKLIKEGIKVCIRIDPIIPGFNDSKEIIKNILKSLDGAFMIVFSTYKAKPDNLKRMKEIFPEIEKLPWDKNKIRGYRYLKENFRKEILERAIDVAKHFTDKIGLCREGLNNLKTTKSCDPVFEI